MPSKKKKYNARFPPARIKKIMQKDEDVGKVAAPVPVLISKALEIFLEGLITKASQETFARNAKTLTTSHIKQCIEQESKFDFLRDLVENVPTMNCEDEDSNHSAGHAEKPTNSRKKQRIGRESSAQNSLQSVDEPSSDEESFDSDESSSRDAAPRLQTSKSDNASSSSSSKVSFTSTAAAPHHITSGPVNSSPCHSLQPSAGVETFPQSMPSPHLAPNASYQLPNVPSGHRLPGLAPGMPPGQAMNVAQGLAPHVPSHPTIAHGALAGNSPAMGSYMGTVSQSASNSNNPEDSDDDYDA